MKARACFEAWGRRAASLGQPLKSPRTWPRFAREAFARGWILQHPIGSKRRPHG